MYLHFYNEEKLNQVEKNIEEMILITAQSIINYGNTIAQSHPESSNEILGILDSVSSAEGVMNAALNDIKSFRKERMKEDQEKSAE